MRDIRTHSQARASMGELVTHKLVYIYSNHVLHTRETVSLVDFSTLYLQPDESDALISALQVKMSEMMSWCCIRLKIYRACSGCLPFS